MINEISTTAKSITKKEKKRHVVDVRKMILKDFSSKCRDS